MSRARQTIKDGGNANKLETIGSHKDEESVTIERKIIFNDFRNIYSENKEGGKENASAKKESGCRIKYNELIINRKGTQLEDLGELIVLIGANNSGKSNVLQGLLKAKASFDKSVEATEFVWDKEKEPYIKFCTNGIEKSRQTKYWMVDKGDDCREYGESPKNPHNKPTPFEYAMSDVLREFLQGECRFVELVGKMDALESVEGDANFVKAMQVIETEIPKKEAEQVRLETQYRYNQPYYAQQKQVIQTNITKLQSLAKEMKEYKLGYAKQKQLDDIVQANCIRQLGVSILPNIVEYSERDIKQKEFEVQNHQIETSTFFQKLFALIEVDLKKVQERYGLYKEQKNKMILTTFAKELNEKLKKLSDQFNALYVSGDDVGKYKFLLDLESVNISFSIAIDNEQNDIPLNIDKQSTGFRWFFNFYFNLLNDANLDRGDIVLMDEPGTSLHMRGQVELRNFLKNYAKESGITFVIATHSPFFIDVDYLDELRIIKKENGFAKIINDFTLSRNDGNKDMLFDIVSALAVGRHCVLNPNDTLIFVEGATDYNYLVAFKKYFKKDGIAFLPINGLRDKHLIGKLCDIAKEPILLVDGDKAGEIANKQNAKEKVEIINLWEVEKSWLTIEDLFAGADKDKVNGDNKTYANSCNIKKHCDEIEKSFSKETIKNFEQLFARLEL
ncbi:MAG: ATP-binding protein [Firmicutes bacterium]|nr:ATP-binding protein [Bacillota bacterium]